MKIYLYTEEIRFITAKYLFYKSTTLDQPRLVSFLAHELLYMLATRAAPPNRAPRATAPVA